MNAAHVAELVRELRVRPSRRAIITALVALGSSTPLASLVARTEAEAKGKGKGKKKKKRKKDENPVPPPPPPPPPGPPPNSPPPPLQCAAGDIACDYLCCSAGQACCGGSERLNPLCYDPAVETCCPPPGIMWLAEVCPSVTICESFADGRGSFCRPRANTRCRDGACNAGFVCCPFEINDGAQCCADGSCDELQTDCHSNIDFVDPRIF